MKAHMKAHSSSYESPLHIESKKQAQASRLQPPALAKLSAFGRDHHVLVLDVGSECCPEPTEGESH